MGERGRERERREEGGGRGVKGKGGKGITLYSLSFKVASDMHRVLNPLLANIFRCASVTSARGWSGERRSYITESLFEGQKS